MDILASFTERGKKTTGGLRDELRSIRANRAHAGLIEDIVVEYYGAPTQIKHLASIQVKPPRELIVQVWDKEAVLKVAKGIEAANLGLSPRVEGQNVCVYLPELTSERREELLRAVKRIAEEYRVRVRTLRDEHRKLAAEYEKSGTISEDEKFNLEKDVQEATDALNREIEDALEKKKKEIEE